MFVGQAVEEDKPERIYKLWNDKLARLQNDKDMIGAQLVKLQGQKESLLSGNLYFVPQTTSTVTR